jgi:hypothetical protein
MALTCAGRKSVKVRIAGLLVLMIALFAGSASAQTVFGATIGWGLASMSVDGDDEGLNDVLADSRNGLDIGAYVEVPVNPMFSMVIAGKYSQKGSTGSFSDGITTIDVTTKLDYIDLPILANFPINTMGSVRPFLYVGGVPSFRVGAKQTGEFEGEEFEEDLDEEVESFDFGLMFGGGVQFGGRYGVAVDYNLGLMNINKESDEGDVKNRQLVVRFIVAFSGQ